MDIACKEIVDFIRAHQLMAPAHIEELAGDVQRFDSVAQLTSELVRRGRLTEFQEMKLLSGQGGHLVFGPYRLMQPLGEGGMGQVIKAWHPRLDRLVALKFIHPESQEKRATALYRFQREARAIAQLQHPNIVLLYDADEIDGTPFIAMEYVDGVSLSELVRREGRLPVNRACDYMRQAALGLQHACECGLVHRDVKPSNILVSRKKSVHHSNPNKSRLITIQDRQRLSDEISGSTDRIKLLDLGLATLNRSLRTDGTHEEITLTEAGAIVGTPDYIAPEQARDSRTVDIRADLYSLGATFYYILTGSVPFPNGGAMEKLIQHQLNNPPPPGQLRAGLPIRVSDIVMRLMAKDPGDRFQTPQDLADALCDYLSSPDVERPSSADCLPSTRITNPSIVVVPTPSLSRAASTEAVGVEFPPFALPVSEQQLPAAESVQLSHTAIGLEKVEFPGQPAERGPIADLPGRHEINPTVRLGGHDGVVIAVAVSPNGRAAVTGDVNGRLRIWDLRESSPRECANTRRVAEIQTAMFIPGRTNQVVFGELRRGKAAIVCWDWQSQSFQDLGDFPSVDQSGIGALAFSESGGMLAAGVGSLAVTWKIENGLAANQRSYKGLESHVRSIAISPDHKMLAATGQQHGLHFWDLSKGRWNRGTGFQSQSQIAAVTTLTYSPDGRVLAMAGLDPDIVLWDLAEGSNDSVQVLQGHASSVLHVQFIGDGAQLVSVAVDGKVLFWDVQTVQIIREHQLDLKMAYRVAISRDAARMVAGFSNGTVAFYPLASESGWRPARVPVLQHAGGK